MESASASRKRSRQAQEDDEVASHNEREKAFDLGGAGASGRGRGRHDDHEEATNEGSIEGRHSVQENSLDFVDPLPKLVVLDLDKTVRSTYRVVRTRYYTLTYYSLGVGSITETTTRT